MRFVVAGHEAGLQGADSQLQSTHQSFSISSVPRLVFGLGIPSGSNGHLHAQLMP